MLKGYGLLAAGALVAGVSFSAGAGAADGSAAVYGDIRIGVDYSDSEGPISNQTRGADTDMRDLNSFAGVKGSVSSGSVTAFGAYETYIDGLVSGALNVSVARQSFLGVTTPAGTLSFGQMFTEYAMTGRAIDPFLNTALANPFGDDPDFTNTLAGAILGATPEPGMPLTSFGLSPLLTGELGAISAGAIQDNQIAYTSPSFGGVTINAALFLDEADDDPAAGENHDYGLGVKFAMAGITAGYQFLQINDDTGNTVIPPLGTAALLKGSGEGQAHRLYGGYACDWFGVNASAELIDDGKAGLVADAGVLDQNYYFAGGWLGLGQGTRLAASVGMTNETGLGEGTGVQVGVFHDVVEGFTVHAGVANYDLQEDQGLAPGPSIDDTHTFAVGASYKFQVGTGK